MVDAEEQLQMDEVGEGKAVGGNHRTEAEAGRKVVELARQAYERILSQTDPEYKRIEVKQLSRSWQVTKCSINLTKDKKKFIHVQQVNIIDIIIIQIL